MTDHDQLRAAVEQSPYGDIGRTGSPDAYLIDPGAGSGSDRVSRFWPTLEVQEDIIRRGGSITPLYALAAATPTPPGDARPYPELLNKGEAKALLSRAEQLWADLQANNLGGFSGINRPFYILAEFKRVIEEFGNRDVGLHWSKDDLDAHSAPATVEQEAREGLFVAGPVWREGNEDECWTAEVQALGGYAVVATVHGGTREQAEARRDAIIAALSRQPAADGDAVWNEAVEACERASPKKSETFYLQDAGYTTGWQAAIVAMRNAILSLRKDAP